MRRTLSLASLLLMGAAVALAGEERSLPLPSPEFLDSLMRESDERVSPYIVGGEAAGPGQFPYTTFMLSRYPAACTSSLIAAGWVLGAEHCLPLGKSGGVPGETFYNTGTVTIGTNLARTDEIPSYVDYGHPDFNFADPTSPNDIALLKLSAYSKLPPVRLQTPALSSLTAPGAPVIASGWGATVFGGPPVQYLRWAQLTVQPDSVCDDIYGGSYDAALNICLSANPKDSCQGDSGGPSVAIDPLTDWPYQVGITSYGIGCGTVAGAVYTRVSAFWDWIRATSGLSLRYYDVDVNGNGFIRATDSTPATGSEDPGYFTPANANKGPKVHFNKSIDSWGVSTSRPAGSTLLSQVHSHGFDIALFGTFPATYDRVVDSLHYTPEECKPAKNGRSIKCFDGTSTVTFSLRGSSGHAKISVKAIGRDIKLGGATHLKAYLWLKNGDNYLMYSPRCKNSRNKMDC